jgi:hypothetical protein
MRLVLALVVTVGVAGVASADMPRPAQRVFAPGSWCSGLMGGLAATVGGLCLARWWRKRV